MTTRAVRRRRAGGVVVDGGATMRSGGATGDAGGVERAFDARPQRRRCVQVGGRQQRHRLAQRMHLGARRFVALDVARHLRVLLTVERVERVQRQELVELGAGQLSVHDDVIPDSTSESRSRRNPTRIRLLTVPSGCSRSVATSR